MEQKKGLINHVHATTMLQRCARGKLVITEAVPLSVITAILFNDSSRIPKAVEAAHTIYGLRMLNYDTKDIKPFLILITSLVTSCEEPFKAQEIGNALYGLQKFSSESLEVRSLITALVEKIRASQAELSPQEISNALYGKKK
jgi:hypothetical protein